MAQPWIKLTKEFEHGVKLFCFPYSGGGAQVFMPFSRVFSSGIDIYALEMPGRGRRFRDPYFDTLPQLVEEAVEAMLPLITSNEFIFFGHSLGGIVAFETARHLRRMNHPIPIHLYASGARAPQVARRGNPISDLPDPVFVEKLRDIGGTLDEVLENEEMRDIFIPILKSDFRLLEKYEYEFEEPLKCPITVFGGTHDRYVRVLELELWKDQTSVMYASHMFEGGHFFIHDHLQEIAHVITRNLSMRRPWP